MRRERRIGQILTLSGLMCISQVSLTAPLWRDFSGTYVAGNGFTLDPDKQQTVTLEHAAGYDWGDTFTYLDTTFFRAMNALTHCLGRRPRAGLSLIPIKTGQIRAVTDVLISASLEFGSGTVETFTLGPSVDLNVAGFDYLHLGLMRRESVNRSGFNNSDGWQFVPTWSLTIPTGRSEWVIDGFAKWIFATDHSDYHPNFQFNPQIKYNVGKHLSGPDTRSLLGN